MRIWDLHPGYLNRQSLLGEHRELHGMVSIIVNGKKGYSRHPETLRWMDFGWALNKRHQLLAAEMTLRGYNDKSPVHTRKNKGRWPDTFIDEPYLQIQLLREKYRDKEPGRIPLPQNAQQMWRQHKYAVMARSALLYKKIGADVARMGPRDDFSSLALLLVETLRTRPSQGGLKNALQHMWGYVSDRYEKSREPLHAWPLTDLLARIQDLTFKHSQPYLMESVALSEFAVWIKDNRM
ncbi:hypothetical protein DO021_05240 [Desulfobacter hydrogenophilus]|uniref:DUF1722 domain-containing protein n=1 Tax=Desulfobacter hydrogenophilus TaxID=2291 RepID=A0A328FJ64_9BACT|nr:DUF1722 domain-containing protein [Desulfobacter hydrogenophilus]NDY70970.1 DUF1722 domain-containing protein [Desulfobacter hydrogenophilus]QBH12790.1 DUF1722 domain-containing protein [Desulfobacter hydrogenophilus]RAM03027.1 hypothetical protein DO021_05240 [Desulfobacter hydrogenophilus]